MKPKIQRLSFIFNNETEQVGVLNLKFVGLSLLLKNIILEKYNGKEIKLINLQYCSSKYFVNYPIPPKDYINHFSTNGGFLSYIDEINLEYFYNLDDSDQMYFIWNKSCENLIKAAISIKNESLISSCEYAFKKGIEIKLNTDFKYLEQEIQLYDKTCIAQIWYKFKGLGASIIFRLLHNGNLIYEQIFDESSKTNDFYFNFIKNIIVNQNIVIIKGHRDINYLPLYIKINEF